MTRPSRIYAYILAAALALVAGAAVRLEVELHRRPQPWPDMSRAEALADSLERSQQ
jgi:hypothetical protein